MNSFAWLMSKIHEKYVQNRETQILGSTRRADEACVSARCIIIKLNTGYQMQTLKCRSSNVPSAHVRIHGLSPAGTVDSHHVNDGATREADKTKDSEEPAVADGADDWGGDKGTHARKDVSHEVVEGDSLGRFLWHEFC